MSRGHITLIDAGTGNLRSVYKALECAGAQVTLTDAADEVRRTTNVVLPGVGAFGDFMIGLRAKGLDEAVHEVLRRGVLLLGICVGMQALFDFSEEMGVHAGLALLRGRVLHFPPLQDLKVPQTGWNQIWERRESPLLARLPRGAYVYFNHSYYCAAQEEDDVVAATDYGLDYASVVQRDNLFGVQFHPEKSQQVGLQILANFIALV